MLSLSSLVKKILGYLANGEERTIKGTATLKFWMRRWVSLEKSVQEDGFGEQRFAMIVKGYSVNQSGNVLKYMTF